MIVSEKPPVPGQFNERAPGNLATTSLPIATCSTVYLGTNLLIVDGAIFRRPNMSFALLRRVPAT